MIAPRFTDGELGTIRSLCSIHVDTDDASNRTVAVLKRVIAKIDASRDRPPCKECGQPMLPRDVAKLPGEYEHANGCSQGRAPGSTRVRR